MKEIVLIIQIRSTPKLVSAQIASIIHESPRDLIFPKTCIEEGLYVTAWRFQAILFQRHAALHVTNNALCLMSGLVSGI